MTPDQLSFLRTTDWQRLGEGNKKVDELCDEIERLQQCNEQYSKREGIVVERLMLERDLAREELSTTKTQLLAMAQVNTDQAAQIEEMQKELALLKQPPKCPKCQSFEINTLFSRSNDAAFIVCCDCGFGGFLNGETTTDEALNAWRKV